LKRMRAKPIAACRPASAKITHFPSRRPALKFLAFDTATEWCSAALWIDGVCTSREIHAGQKHSDLLVPMLMELLAESGLTLHQLDALVYGMGPGSFTGLRIASGVAQGLALAADLPVLGISTLETLAEEAGANKVLACLDARMHEVYAALYQREGQLESATWHCLAGPLVCPPDAVPLPESDDFVGVGSGFAAYPNLAQSHLNRIDASLIPHARSMARLAAPRLQRREGESAEKAEPLYIRNKVALKICER
jgi:tRNA threonylcarbamoyladenosine biosynthesis protein TsaB